MHMRRKLIMLMSAGLLLGQLAAAQTSASRPDVAIDENTPAHEQTGQEGMKGEDAGQAKTGEQTSVSPGGAAFVGASAWALDDLRKASEGGLTEAVQSLEYRASITRAQFCRIVVKLYERLVGLEVPDVERNPFTDTDDPAVLKAFSLGIVNGVAEDRFSPDALITREQLASMLERAVRKTGRDIPAGDAVPFVDADQFAPYAAEAINAMSAIEVIKGITVDTFGPKSSATVEQAVIMAQRLLERMEAQMIAEDRRQEDDSPGGGQDEG